MNQNDIEMMAKQMQNTHEKAQLAREWVKNSKLVNKHDASISSYENLTE